MRIGAVVVVVAAVLASSSAAAPDALPGGVLVLSCSGCASGPAGSSLYTMRPGGMLHRIRGTEGAYEPDWSADGRSIVYSVGFQRIWRSAANGSRPRRLTARAHTSDLEPAWSPDGRSILFTRVEEGDADRTSLWRVPAAGGRQRRVLTAPTNVVDPSWAPDGSRIAFGDVAGRLWVARANGSRRRRLAPNRSGQTPRWSPDGTRIAFLESEPAAVSLVDLGTGRTQRLVPLRAADIGGLAWSPDGRWLVVPRQRFFECERDAPDECSALELVLVRVRDRRLRVIPLGVGEPYGVDWRR